MITLEQLISLQNTIGFDCKLIVYGGIDHGDIWVRISAPLPNGRTYKVEELFTGKEFLRNEYGHKDHIDRFKHNAKLLFDVKFAEYKL